MARECALITGSGRGLGRDLAHIFAENDHDIILNARNKENLESVSKEIEKLGVNCYSKGGDIRDVGTRILLSDLAQDKSVSVLINNAGAPSLNKPYEQVGYEEIEEMIETNVLAPMKLIRSIYPTMIKQGKGTIININSICGYECKETKITNCASRWGLRGFTGGLRLEADKHGIKVIGVYPTRIKTRPEYTFGMESRDVVEKIYEAYASGFSGILKLDGRPKEFRPKEDIEYG